MKRHVFLFLVISWPALAWPPAIAAQFTQVMGTVVDPHGIPYSNGTIMPNLIISGSPRFTSSGFPYVPPSQPTGLDARGSFVMSLADVTQLTPSGGVWSFTVNCAAGCIPPSGGVGPVTFTTTGIIISGTVQDISSVLQLAAPPLTGGGGGGGGEGGPTVNGNPAPFNFNLNNTTPPAPPFGLNIHFQNNGAQISGSIVGDGNASDCFRGDGTFGTCPGGGGGSGTVGPGVVNQFALYNGTTSIVGTPVLTISGANVASTAPVTGTSFTGGQFISNGTNPTPTAGIGSFGFNGQGSPSVNAGGIYRAVIIPQLNSAYASQNTTAWTFNGTAANPPVCNPVAPANGRCITVSGVQVGTTFNMSAALVGDGSTNCLNGQGVYAPCGAAGGGVGAGLAGQFALYNGTNSVAGSPDLTDDGSSIISNILFFPQSIRLSNTNQIQATGNTTAPTATPVGQSGIAFGAGPQANINNLPLISANGGPWDPIATLSISPPGGGANLAFATNNVNFSNSNPTAPANGRIITFSKATVGAGAVSTDMSAALVGDGSTNCLSGQGSYVPCGSGGAGSGTVGFGSTAQMAFYSTSGTSIVGTPNLLNLSGSLSATVPIAPLAGINANNGNISFSTSAPTVSGNLSQLWFSPVGLQLSQNGGAFALLGTGGGGGIGGSGTTGFVPVFTAASTLGNSNIAATTSQITIGSPPLTSNPGVETDVNPSSIANCAGSNVVPLGFSSSNIGCFGYRYQYSQNAATSSGVNAAFFVNSIGSNSSAGTLGIGVYGLERAGFSIGETRAGYFEANESINATVGTRRGLMAFAGNSTGNITALNEALVAQTGAIIGTNTNDYSMHCLAPAGAGTLTTHACVKIEAQGTGVEFQTGAHVFANLPACTTAYEGSLAAITDSTVTAGTVTGGGTNHVLSFCNGSAWTVAGGGGGGGGAVAALSCVNTSQVPFNASANAIACTISLPAVAHAWITHCYIPVQLQIGAGQNTSITAGFSITAPTAGDTLFSGYYDQPNNVFNVNHHIVSGTGSFDLVLSNLIQDTVTTGNILIDGVLNAPATAQTVSFYARNDIPAGSTGNIAAGSYCTMQ